MKKSLKSFFSQPKKAVPLVALIVVGLSIFAFMHIGNAPVVPASVTLSDTDMTIAPGSNVSLSFAQGGRVEAVLAHEGDMVAKGQILARLSAPQAQGAVSQAKGALDLAQAQYASLNSQYDTAKKQQDVIVANAYNTLLSSGLEGTSNVQDTNIPVISGTYTCGKEGSYVLKPYTSGDNDSGFSMNYSGLESGNAGVKYTNAVPIGNCGLQVKFVHSTNFNPLVVWTINIPNTKSSTYVANKNAYDLAIETREKVLADLSTTISGNESGSVAKAQIDAARGAYEAALGAYQNNLIISPVAGTITFIDSDLKVGQSITASKSVISISAQ